MRFILFANGYPLGLSYPYLGLMWGLETQRRVFVSTFVHAHCHCTFVCTLEELCLCALRFGARFMTARRCLLISPPPSILGRFNTPEPQE